jgi:glycosyltransferase involved in cell wall biosynthesis
MVSRKPTCHDLTVLTHAQFHTVENKVNCLLGVLRALYRGTHFLAISQATAQDLKQHLGVPAERITRVYSGTASHFRPLPEGQAAARVAERFGLTRPFVLSVGTLEPRKNLRRLLEAYAGLSPELRQEFPLVICGGAGWKHEETAAYLARQPELSGVRQLGRVADADLVALYGAAAVFAFPSLAEGFGLPVVEAMACGTPVVTANLSALPEIAGAGGLLVDPYDVAAIRQALCVLLSQPAERQRLGQLALDQAAKFSWTQTARETLALYERVAASAG